MRAKEFVKEIEKIPTYHFSGDESDIGYFTNLDYKKAKPLDGGIKIILTQNSGDDYAVILIPKYHRVIGSVSYHTHITQSGGKELEISSAALDKDFRGQGIITKAYKFLMRHFKAPIRAGSIQTIKAQRLWANLSRDPEITVVGYIDMVRSELGGKEFLDKLKKMNIKKADKRLQPRRHHIRFLVPVKTLNSGILSFNKKTRVGGNLYGDGNYDTGLLAILKTNKLKESKTLNEGMTFSATALEDYIDSEGNKSKIFTSRPFSEKKNVPCFYCDGTGKNPHLEWALARNDTTDPNELKQIELCSRCEGAGTVEEYVSMAPELDVSNSNGFLIQEILGIEPDFAGSVRNKDLPELMRKLIMLKNQNSLQNKYVRPTEIKKGEVSVSQDNGIPRISRGPTMINIGTNQQQIERYIDRLIEIVKFAQQNNAHLSWA